jgi:hypothetical protein
VSTELILFVGGPLDGMTKEVPTSLGAFEVPVPTLDGRVVNHRYGQADLVDGGDVAFTAEGHRRYVYLGEAKTF